MTDPHELVRPLSGEDWWNVPASGEVLGFRVSDGPSGVRGQRFVGGPPSVSFPCGAALGATWDVALLRRVGAALATEAKAKGAHVVLGPTVNLQRTPLGGRHFECFSEDPLLTARLASAYVEGLQGEGVGACVKHLVANDQERDRFEISSEPDDRTLREVSLLPFEHALRGAGAWSTMAAYNRLHGTHCSQHRWLLTTVLREEWGWDGVVVSDWFAVHGTAEPVLAGLDLEMPGPAVHFGGKLAAAMEAGEVPVAAVEQARARLARLGGRTGAGTPVEEQDGGAPDVLAVARDAAAAATVLLRNQALLPLSATGVQRVAVLGPHADVEVIQGGGSARVTPTDAVTVAGGLRERLGDGGVVVEAGVSASRGTPAIPPADLRRADGTVGADAEILGADGAVRVRLRPRELRVLFLDDATEPEPGWAARLTSRFTPRLTGAHRFKVKTNGVATLRVDGTEVDGPVELVAGEAVDVEVAVTLDDPRQRLAAEVRCEPPLPDDAFDRAVAAARGADVAVVVVGLDGEWETEGRDRDTIDLPGRQVELVEAVAAAQPRTVVVVLAGSPIELAWAERVPALLWAWYPGQEGGRAIADLLFGDREPGGRLPCTFPVRLEDTPSFGDDEPGVLRYREGVVTGHRWYDVQDIDPVFPFGHGLGYTSWSLGAPVVDGLEVRAPLANTGGRRGAQVVQLYVAAPGSPFRALRGFERVEAGPGDEAVVAFTLGPRDLARWDPESARWVVDAGEHQVWVGTSSRDLVGPVPLTVPERWTAAASDPISAG